ncbi:uncharacterized protein METZ01_LOCUS406571 [marine metagenome]|uniref:Uncharacterized protein n=1 Tax=marine metagenome TaxID=408172 RepID=A0A382W4L0_9ZZZZ
MAAVGVLMNSRPHFALLYPNGLAIAGFKVRCSTTIGRVCVASVVLLAPHDARLAPGSYQPPSHFLDQRRLYLSQQEQSITVS